MTPAQFTERGRDQRSTFGSRAIRAIFAIAGPPVAVGALVWSLLQLQAAAAPGPLLAVAGVAVAIVGIFLVYFVLNWSIEQLPRRWNGRVVPFLFVGPCLGLLTWYLLIPTLRTFVMSMQDANSVKFVGIDNYVFAFTDPGMLETLRNNLIWLVFGTGGAVVVGLLVAILADHSSFGRAAKTLIFMPMAISFVGASIIWRFVLAYQPVGETQYGLANATLAGLGQDPVAWLTIPFWNTVVLVAIFIWGQAGLAMVVLSAAIRGVPKDLQEAARLDGASEVGVYTEVILPIIKPVVIAVSTMIAVFSLKIYDIVRATTNGNFGTDVVATNMYNWTFSYGDSGKGAALAIILLVAVLPVVGYNLRHFKGREGLR